MHPSKNLLCFHKRTILTLFMIIIFIWNLFSVEWDWDLLHPGGRTTLLQMIEALFHPDFSSEILILAMVSSWRTLAYAVAGMTLAFCIGFLFGIFASGILAAKNSTRFIIKVIFRNLLGFMRAIHELVWAWLFTAAIGLSPITALFALAITYGGILGRIFADILNDIPREPIKALKSSGASKLQLISYGYMPIAKVDIISYTMYRFECAVRSAAIMSFVGLGGLGYQIQLALADLNYNKMWTYLFFLIGLVLSIDVWSNLLRKRLVE